MNQSKCLVWIRSSWIGHIVLFGLGGGGTGAFLFLILLRSEGPLAFATYEYVCMYWVFSMAIIGLLFWLGVTAPSLKKRGCRRLEQRSDEINARK